MPKGRTAGAGLWRSRWGLSCGTTFEAARDLLTSALLVHGCSMGPPAPGR